MGFCRYCSIKVSKSLLYLRSFCFRLPRACTQSHTHTVTQSHNHTTHSEVDRHTTVSCMHLCVDLAEFLFRFLVLPQLQIKNNLHTYPNQNYFMNVARQHTKLCKNPHIFDKVFQLYERPNIEPRGGSLLLNYWLRLLECLLQALKS